MTRTLWRRLLPLILANFTLGLMFHYSIVFPFMDSLGLTTTQLAAYVLCANLVLLIVEMPAGILADRWSRKGMMLASLVFMAAACALYANADSYIDFVVGGVVAAIFFGMSTGVQEAMLYDLLLENGQRKQYEKILGRLRSVFTAGLVVSSVVGAVLASQYSFQWPFYVSIASCAASFLLILFFREPKLHRQVESAKLLIHLKDLVSALGKRSETRLLVLTNVVIGIEFCFMLEIDPLWPIALGLAVIWYGPLNAFLLSSQGFAGLLTGVASRSNRLTHWIGCGLLLGAVGLTIQNIIIVAISQFVLLMCATVLMIVLGGRIQDTLPSNQRSGAESAVSTLSRLSFIIVLPLFSLIAEASTVFMASWILVIIALLSMFGLKQSMRIATE